jgi:uncharacterized protein YjbI with pentapeptide repeats
METSAPTLPSSTSLDHGAAAKVESECGFRSDYSDRPPCPRPGSEPDDRCLLHSSNPDKDAEAFWRTIEQQLASCDGSFVGYVFPEQATFRRAQFLAPVSFGEACFSREVFFDGAEFAMSASFDRAKFGGNASFDGARFVGEASFKRVEFAADASFKGAAFSGVASFDKARFTRLADFYLTEFSGTSARFEEAEFWGSTSFLETKFLRDAWFRQAKFLSWASFEQTEFSGLASFVQANFSDTESTSSFDRTKFVEWAEFDQAEFFGEAVFERSKFLSQASFDHVKFCGVTIFNTDIEHVGFRSSNLGNCRFAGSSNLDKAEFDDISWSQWPVHSTWPGQRARLAVADEIVARSALPADKPSLLAAAERVYRDLRRNYETRKDHPRIGSFYFAEMEMRRLASSSSWPGQTIGSLTAWYGMISGYGGRWGRALGWALAVCCVWALLYLLVGLWIKTPEINEKGLAETHLVFVGIASAPSDVPAISGLLSQYGHALLHSFLVATLIGRDIYAQPINAVGQVVQTIEIVLGPLLLGLMGLAIRRQFQR